MDFSWCHIHVGIKVIFSTNKDFGVWPLHALISLYALDVTMCVCVSTCACVRVCMCVWVSSPSLPVSIVHNNLDFSPQHWSNISIDPSIEWPLERSHHAATHLSGPLFVIVGGLDQSYHTLKDMWLCDTTTKLWKKVELFVYLHVASFLDSRHSGMYVWAAKAWTSIHLFVPLGFSISPNLEGLGMRLLDCFACACVCVAKLIHLVYYDSTCPGSLAV